MPSNNNSCPTLILSECCFIYLPTEKTNHILHWVSTNIPNAMFVVYEQIKPNDQFGMTMMQNLKVGAINTFLIYDDKNSNNNNNNIKKFSSNTDLK